MKTVLTLAAALVLALAVSASAGINDYTWGTQVWDDFSLGTVGNALAGTNSASGWGTWANGGAGIDIFHIQDDGTGNLCVEAHQSTVTGAAARYTWLTGQDMTLCSTADVNRLSFRAKFISNTTVASTRGVNIQWANNTALANGVPDGTGVELSMDLYAGEAGWGNQIRSGAPETNNWIGTQSAGSGAWQQFDMLMYRDGSNLVEWYVDGVLLESKDFDGMQWVDDAGTMRWMEDIEMFAVTRDTTGLMTWLIDDISIQYNTAVPEPSGLIAFATFGIGMIGLAIRRRA